MKTMEVTGPVGKTDSFASVFSSSIFSEETSVEA